jgi:hypothetical protein
LLVAFGLRAYAAASALPHHEELDGRLADRLPNGNTLIVESDAGRAFEVTAEGEIVWEFLNPDRMPDGRPQPLYRSMRHSHAFVAQFL